MSKVSQQRKAHAIVQMPKRKAKHKATKNEHERSTGRIKQIMPKVPKETKRLEKLKPKTVHSTVEVHKVQKIDKEIFAIDLYAAKLHFNQNGGQE